MNIKNTNSKLILPFWIICLLVAIPISISSQTSHSVDVTKNVFTPAEIAISLGDTVIWTNSDGFHNVNGLQSKYPSNPESFGNSTGSGWTFNHVFTLPGTYDYQCDPHVGLGMVGKVFVEAPPDTLTINFSKMTPHLDQMLSIYVRDKTSGDYLDTIILVQISNAAFTIKSTVIETGKSYVVDLFADHNKNGIYDKPPIDHAWRIDAGEATGNINIAFEHNTNFRDIETPFGPHVRVSEDPSLGSILTDANGYTLYYYTKDALPDSSLCTGGCVTNWPLFYVENPEIGEGLNEDDFSSIVHPEGGMQTTYKGWPLYYFKNDLNSGETNGEAVGNVWFVAKPDYSIMLLDNILIGKDGITYNGNYEPGEEVVQYFVDENGMALYIFINDRYDQNKFTNPDFSNNPFWPIYEEELQSVASILDKDLFGSIDVYGRPQLTYKGWPLYYYITDSVRGNTTGVSVPNPGIWPIAVKDLEAAPTITSVEEFTEESGIQLYPNPATNEVNIVSSEKIESLTLLSVTGTRLIHIPGIQARHHRLSLEGISTGVYFIEIRSTDNNLKVSRLVKR